MVYTVHGEGRTAKVYNPIGVLLVIKFLPSTVYFLKIYRTPDLLVAADPVGLAHGLPRPLVPA
jgi:hypothetical protein